MAETSLEWIIPYTNEVLVSAMIIFNVYTNRTHHYTWNSYICFKALSQPSDRLLSSHRLTIHKH
jgi:hypothetical protein